MRVYKIRVITILLIISILCSSCSVLFPTQRMLDDVLPYRDTHFYCDSDLIPFSKAELKNAKTVYGVELSEYFYANKDRSDFTEEENDDFLRILSYRNHNYKLVRERYEKYNDDTPTDIDDYNEADQEFNSYYKLSDSPLSDIIRKQNNGRLMGNPNISFKIKIEDIKNIDNIYYEGEADIFIPTYIEQKDYEKINIGDEIELNFPVSNMDTENSETIKKKIKCVATDSFIYTDDNDNEEVYFVAPKDGIGDKRKIINTKGEVVETFAGKRPIRILKYARIAEGIDQERLVTSIMQGGGMQDYNIDEIVDKGQGGGYVADNYKEYIYANAVYTDLKGYITTAIKYNALYIDIDYAKEYIQRNPTNVSGSEVLDNMLESQNQENEIE